MKVTDNMKEEIIDVGSIIIMPKYAFNNANKELKKFETEYATTYYMVIAYQGNFLLLNINDIYIVNRPFTSIASIVNFTMRNGLKILSPKRASMVIN